LEGHSDEENEQSRLQKQHVEGCNGRRRHEQADADEDDRAPQHEQERRQRLWQQEPQVNDDTPVNLNARRFAALQSVAGVPPRSALDAAITAIESGAENPTHVIVLFGNDVEGGGSRLRYFNSGSYSSHAQAGLLASVLGRFSQND